VDGSVAWRAALIQGTSLAVAAVALAAALPRSFFEDFGWIAGPAVWAACALLVAALLRLPALAVLAGAALTGLLSLAGVLVGEHWIGTPFGIVLLGLWCGRLAAGARRRRGDPASAAAG
jgi:hypothetical protein